MRERLFRPGAEPDSPAGTMKRVELPSAGSYNPIGDSGFAIWIGAQRASHS